MEIRKDERISIRDIARATGFSPSHVSYALLNRPFVKSSTRKQILRVARKMGYVPDGRLASLLTGVRAAKEKSFLPIAWLNTTETKDAWRRWKFMSPCLEGARDRALELGYRLEELWLHAPDMSMARLGQILYQRGIEGVIVTPPAKRVHLKWNHLAAVTFGGDLLAPQLPRIDADIYYNLNLALKMVKRHGYRRIGICVSESYDRYSHRMCSAVALHFYQANPKLAVIPALFYPGEHQTQWPTSKKLILAWLRRYRIEVIVCHSSHMVDLLESNGYSVPSDIGVVHLATDDDVSDWAGICSNRRQEGGLAVETVVSLMQRSQFGLPEIASTTCIRGEWHSGRTLPPSA